MSFFNNFGFCDMQPKIWDTRLLFSLFMFVSQIEIGKTEYHKGASSRPSRLVAYFHIFRRLLKGKFDAYVL